MLNEIKLKRESKHTKKEWRGIASGTGKLVDAVIKDKSLELGQSQVGFEGGQMPLQRRSQGWIFLSKKY